MPGPDDTVRLETPLDERAGFAPPSDNRFPAGFTATAGDQAVLPAGLQQRGISFRAPAPLSRPKAGPWSTLREAVSTEWERGTTFLFIPVLLAAGALTYFALDREPAFAEIGASTCLIGLLGWLARSRLVVHLALIGLLCFVLGVLFAKVETWRAGTKMLGGEISTRLKGRVAAIEHMADDRVRLTLDVIDTERPRLRYAPDRVRVSARAIPDGLSAGETVVGLARLAPPSGPTRPGGYDFAFESYFDGIGAAGFFLGQPERAAEMSSAADVETRFSIAVENLRTGLAERIRAAIHGEAEGEIAAALIAGVRAGIPEDVNEALRRTGLAHVLSISGLHMALVAATIMFALRAGFAFFPGFSSRRPVKKYAAGAGLLALAVYLFISGSAVAAERSFIMIGVMLLAVIFDRQALTMRNLAISAIVIIAISPHEVAGPSFQMSFAATAALIGAYAAWSERRQSRRPPEREEGAVRRILRVAGGYALGLAITSLIAGTATMIFGAYHFQRVSPLGLAANLAAMPIVSALVMPFALLGMVLMPFGLDQWAFAVMGKGISAMIAVAQWFSAMSPVDAVGPIPASAVVVLTLALVLATLPTTWLRLAAVPFLLAGLLTVTTRTLPDVLISEDGRLVAIRTGEAVAVNRARPSAFTTEDWQRALMAKDVLKPKDGAAADPPTPAPDDGFDGFVCAGDACVARTTGEALVAYAATAALAQPFCATATLVVIDDATVKDVCRPSGVAVITKRDLARRGSASIVFHADGNQVAPKIDFSVDEPYRPWHAHRAFSREARGLPSYERRKPAAESKLQPANTAGSDQPTGPAP